jgi:hypothetical protein
VSDIDTAAADSLKALDLEWPIREADIARKPLKRRSDPQQKCLSKQPGFLYRSCFSFGARRDTRTLLTR